MATLEQHIAELKKLVKELLLVDPDAFEREMQSTVTLILDQATRTENPEELRSMLRNCCAGLIASVSRLATMRSEKNTELLDSVMEMMKGAPPSSPSKPKPN
jgi:hypothetical protein